MDTNSITKAFIVAAFAVLLLGMLFDVAQPQQWGAEYGWSETTAWSTTLGR